jgi:beta-barrel assembly-enhancing protease
MLALLLPMVLATQNPVARIVAVAWQQADNPPVLDPKHEADVQNDKELGKKYSAEVDKELKASADGDGLKRVQRIGGEMAEIANRTLTKTLWGDKRFSPFDYQFKLVEGKDVNAFSLPGGYIYVYDGLLKYVESDDELAGVLAHEIGHAALRHVATLQREQSKLNAIQLPLILVAILAGGSSGAAGALGLGSLVGTAVGNGWSVKAEQAADYAGFQYIAQSKYNPTGMLTMMERLARDERGGPNIDWGIYRTHPPSRERASALEADISRAGIPVQRSAVTTSYRATMRPGENLNVDVLFGGRRIVSFSGTDAIQRADELVPKLNTFMDSEPDLFDLEIDEDGIVLARRRALFQISPIDAEAAKRPLADYQKDVMRNLKTAIYGLAYRVWDTR